MNTTDRELLRLAILRVLDAGSTRFGLGLTAIAHSLGVYGFPETRQDTIVAELLYLFDKGWVAAVDKLMSPENKSWRITANGRDFLAQHG